MKVSANSFSKKSFKRGSNPVNGDNLSDAPRADDLYSTDIFGVNEMGSIAHFLNRKKIDVSH